MSCEIEAEDKEGVEQIEEKAGEELTTPLSSSLLLSYLQLF